MTSRAGRALGAAVVGALAAAVAAAGCSSSGPASPAGQSRSAAASGGPVAGPAAAPGQPLRWRPCPKVGSGLRCASLKVPVNYAKPGGRQLTLALSEAPATAPAGRRLGALLVNPGGPGGSGLGLASYVASRLTPAVAARYDIVGFDTRGTGSSVPALHCDRSFFAGVRPGYIPASKAAERVLTGRARAYAADCEQRFGWLLPYLTTRDMARDLNSIRIALRQPRISYFAYSYGTYLGQVFAMMFPHRIARMVLDSTVDPMGIWYADNLAQDYAFQGRIRAFFAWTARHADSYGLGKTAAAVSDAWRRARARLAAHPVAGPAGPAVGADEYDDMFLSGGYNDQFWPALATVLAAYLNQGATAPLLRLWRDIGRQSENEFAVYNAVECVDVAWPRNWARWDADTRKVYAKAPFEAWDNTWFNAACAFWPVHGPARPMKISGAGLPGILMLQGTADPATPYAGALAARRVLPSARMVVVQGGGNHGQSLATPPNSCVDGYLNRYLATGALPSGRGLVSAKCPAGPPPQP